jgi:hypothetical protein
VCVLAAVIAGTAEAAQYPIRFPRLTDLASQIAGKPVDVFCESLAEWSVDPFRPRDVGNRQGAYTAWHFDTPLYAVLSPFVCGHVVLLIADPTGALTRRWLDPDADERQASALQTFIHESMHLRGDKDEGRVECAAIRAFRSVARSLSVPPKRVARLWTFAWAEHLRLPAEYRSVC